MAKCSREHDKKSQLIGNWGEALMRPSVHSDTVKVNDANAQAGRGDLNVLASPTATIQPPHMKVSKLYATIIAVGGLTVALSAADPNETWEKNCAKCHGADGAGQTKMGAKIGVKDFTDPKYQATFTDEKAVAAIKEGVKEGEKVRMKPLEGATDADAKALVAKVRGFKK